MYFYWYIKKRISSRHLWAL